MVKFAFRTDADHVEHLWASLLELHRDTFKAHVRTVPVSHNGTFQRIQERPIADLEDWTVALRDGRIRGGYGYQVMFHRLKERVGQPPKNAVDEEGRFLDHDIAALLRTSESS